MSEYTAKALIEPRDYRVVFVIQIIRLRNMGHYILYPLYSGAWCISPVLFLLYITAKSPILIICICICKFPSLSVH